MTYFLEKTVNLMKSALLGSALLACAIAANAASSPPIKIGEINSYSTIPQFTLPYRQGWELAVEEINQTGGLLGRKVEVIARDDAGKPEEALRHAIELTSREKVDVLAGGFFSNVGLALADHAQKNKRVFIASEPLTDAIFNVTFGADLAKLVREGNQRSIFPKTPVVSMLSGEPEYLDVLKDETPPGWIVTGYPWDQIDSREHASFAANYYRRFKDYPKVGSVVGYATMQAIFAAIKKANSTDNEKLVTALRGLKFPTPFGPAEFRAIDHQSTMGAFVGTLALRGNKGTMVQWRYADGKAYLPSDAYVKARRPAEAMK